MSKSKARKAVKATKAAKPGKVRKAAEAVPAQAPRPGARKPLPPPVHKTTKRAVRAKPAEAPKPLPSVAPDARIREGSGHVLSLSGKHVLRPDGQVPDLPRAERTTSITFGGTMLRTLSLVVRLCLPPWSIHSVLCRPSRSTPGVV